MSDVDRLKAELKLAELSEKLEEAREAMFEDNNEETLAAYKSASKKVADARSAFRQEYRVEVGPGDAAPEVDTVNSTAAASLEEAGE